jgi:ribosome-associated protein
MYIIGSTLMNDELDPFDLPEKPSKTQRKRDMEALQALGEALMSFDPKKLANLNLPVELMTAMVEANRISQKKACRRHRQYVGRLMRDLDEETLAAIRSYLAIRGK